MKPMLVAQVGDWGITITGFLEGEVLCFEK